MSDDYASDVEARNRLVANIVGSAILQCAEMTVSDLKAHMPGVVAQLDHAYGTGPLKPRSQVWNELSYDEIKIVWEHAERRRLEEAMSGPIKRPMSPEVLDGLRKVSGWNQHGYWIGPLAKPKHNEIKGTFPSKARCGGPNMCKTCTNSPTQFPEYIDA